MRQDDDLLSTERRSGMLFQTGGAMSTRREAQAAQPAAAKKPGNARTLRAAPAPHA
jgi:hypothetical protein